MKTAFKVCVLVAVKDSGGLLTGCLESLARQTAADEIEVLVLDGGDTACDREIALRSAVPRLRYVRCSRPGLYAAWNEGLRICRSELVMNLNSDDRLARNAVETLASALDANPAVSLAYADSYVTSVAGETFQRNSSGGKHTGWPDYSHRALLVQCICGPHPMWRRRLHDEIGEFDESFRIAGDYEFWLRAAEHGRFMRVPGVLGLYHANPRGLSLADPEELRKENLRIKKMYFRCS